MTTYYFSDIEIQKTPTIYHRRHFSLGDADQEFKMASLGRLSGLSPAPATVTEMNISTLVSMILENTGIGDRVTNETIISKLDILPSTDDQQYFVETLIEFFTYAVTSGLTSSQVHHPKDVVAALFLQISTNQVLKLLDEWKSLTKAEKTGLGIGGDTCYENLSCYSSQKNYFSDVFGPMWKGLSCLPPYGYFCQSRHIV